MRLHENDLKEPGKQEKLKKWLKEQSLATGEVKGDWTQSEQILNAPASRDKPVIAMLDPFRIVPDKSDNSDRPGYLRSGLLRMLCGEHCLKLCDVPSEIPVVICLFSYSDVNANIPDRVVRDQFKSNWHIQNVRSGPWKLRGVDSFHQGWVVSRNQTNCTFPNLQSAWNEWSEIEVEEPDV